MNIIPIRDHIALRPDEAEAQVAGYIVPDAAQKRPKRGTVIAVGPGKHAEDTGVLIPMQLKEGDEVYYSKYSGSEIEVNGEIIIVLRESECLLIV